MTPGRESDIPNRFHHIPVRGPQIDCDFASCGIGEEECQTGWLHCFHSWLHRPLKCVPKSQFIKLYSIFIGFSLVESVVSVFVLFNTNPSMLRTEPFFCCCCQKTKKEILFRQSFISITWVPLITENINIAGQTYLMSLPFSFVLPMQFFKMTEAT